MVFFQAVLLGGYLFAHFSTSRIAPRWHAGIQVLVLTVPLLLLPIAVPGGRSLVGENAAFSTLSVLTIMVGLPFFALATSSPTLQRWFSLTDHPSAQDPYFLYAAGNIGSLSALVAYPLVVEPNLSLSAQARWWAIAYGAFVAVSAGCAVVVSNRPAVRTMAAASRSVVSWAQRLRWVFWAFVPSALMLSVTRHLTADVASFPLLWIIPLILYLLTFIVAFAVEPDRLLGPANVVVRIGSVLLVLLFVAPIGSTTQQLAVHLGWFFSAALLGHLRLSKDRPPPDSLTEFYAWISVGGVFGGAFIALIAPAVFTRVLEYPMVVGAALVMVVANQRGRASFVSLGVIATRTGRWPMAGNHRTLLGCARPDCGDRDSGPRRTPQRLSVCGHARINRTDRDVTQRR